MNITNNSFSFTDYIGYLFPGLLLIIGLYFSNPDILSFLLKDKILISIVLLITSYYAGYASIITSSLIIEKIENFFGDLYTSTYNKKLCPYFKKKLVTSLRKEYGTDLVLHGNKSNLVYLCWIDIQKEPNHGALNYQSRLISLRTICTASFIPVLILSYLSFKPLGIWISIFFIFIFIILIFAWRDLKISFAKHVFRIWYIQNK